MSKSKSKSMNHKKNIYETKTNPDHHYHRFPPDGRICANATRSTRSASTAEHACATGPARA